MGRGQHGSSLCSTPGAGTGTDSGSGAGSALRRWRLRQFGEAASLCLPHGIFCRAWFFSLPGWALGCQSSAMSFDRLGLPSLPSFIGEIGGTDHTGHPTHRATQSITCEKSVEVAAYKARGEASGERAVEPKAQGIVKTNRSRNQGNAKRAARPFRVVLRSRIQATSLLTFFLPERK